MILDLDAGNSRIKWRFSGRTGNARLGVYVVEHPETAPAALIDVLQGQTAEVPQRIRVSSVRGADFAARFAQAANRQWQIEPEFAAVTHEAAGVRNAYENPSAMGVDRWLALLAAFHQAGGSCCVLDCGSAMTFDWADADGRHQGGYIVPGLSLMRESLVGKTPALAVPLAPWGETAPGSSTATAIGNGILVMAAGFAARCREQVVAVTPDCQWFLTGGDAHVLSAQLPWPHILAADLVLDGLALALP
ncbi:MAG: type III pantothenate kinase [Pseudohongiellaceae bacterium]|jgi:type III pantothenate kinase